MESAGRTVVAVNEARVVRNSSIASFVLAGIGLWLVLYLHLVPCFVATLLVVTLVDLWGRRFRTIDSQRARVIAVTLLSTLVILALVGIGLGIAAVVRRELGQPGTFIEHQLMPLIVKARAQLPEAFVAWLPGNGQELQTMVMDALHSHSIALREAGVHALRLLVQLLIGMVLGAIIALSQVRQEGVPVRPLSSALFERCANLAAAFTDIVFAQVRISGLNTLLTGLFLLVVLPLFGVYLPLAKTLVVFTFVVGLLPVVGNLISNVAITISALSISPAVGGVALLYLIAIHKLEYLLNARIVGSRIRAGAWELLAAMLVMEAAYGISGLVVAPIYYAYLKRELRLANLV